MATQWPSRPAALWRSAARPVGWQLCLASPQSSVHSYGSRCHACHSANPNPNGRSERRRPARRCRRQLCRLTCGLTGAFRAPADRTARLGLQLSRCCSYSSSRYSRPATVCAVATVAIRVSPARTRICHASATHARACTRNTHAQPQYTGPLSGDRTHAPPCSPPIPPRAAQHA